MADINNIPTPKMEMPPELKKLVEEVKSINEAAKKAEKSDKPSTDAKYIVEKFHKDMGGFEHAYAYLTEKLADKLIDGFAENVAELIAITDLTKETNSALYQIDNTLIHIRRDLVEVLDAIQNNDGKNKETDQNKYLRELVNISKWSEVNRLAKDRRDQYIKDREDKENTNLEKNLLKERRTAAKDRLEEKEPTGIISMLGKILGIKHVKSLAGFLGGFALTWGRWTALSLKLFKIIGPGAILVAIAYEFMNSTFKEMYDAYRNKGNTVAISIVKAMGEQIQDLINVVLEKFGIDRSKSKTKTEERHQETIIQGKLNQLREQIEKLTENSDERIALYEKYEAMLREEKTLNDEWKKAQNKIDQSRNYWFVQNREQIKVTRENITMLEGMMKEWHKKFDSELTEIVKESSLVADELNELRKTPLSKRSSEEKQRIEFLTLRLSLLKEREGKIRNHYKKMKSEYEWAVINISDSWFVWEDIVDWATRLWSSFKDSGEERDRQSQEWEAFWKKNIRKTDGSDVTLGDKLKFIIKHPLRVFTTVDDMIQGFKNWLSFTWKSNKDYYISLFNKNIWKPIEDTLDSIGNLLTDIKNYFVDWFKGWAKKIAEWKDSILGKSKPNNIENPLAKDLMPRTDDPYLFEKQSYVAPQSNDLNVNTQLLKAINNLVRDTEKTSLAQIVNTKSSTITNTNSNATNISAPTTVVASIPPLGVPWSNFNDFGPFKVGYGI